MSIFLIIMIEVNVDLIAYVKARSLDGQDVVALVTLKQGVHTNIDSITDACMFMTTQFKCNMVCVLDIVDNNAKHYNECVADGTIMLVSNTYFVSEVDFAENLELGFNFSFSR